MSHLIQATRRPLSALEATKLRQQILAQIEKEPRSCPALAKRHKMHDKTMMNHLRTMAQLGLVHSVKSTGTRAPYLWTLGPGECATRRRATTTPEAVELQLRVTSWPPVTVPKQNPWSALGL